MRVASFALAIAAAGTALTASPALAGNSRELVRYDDLRLTTAEGQAELQKRLDKAAWKACMFDTRGTLRTGEQQTACYHATRKDAAVRMAQVLATPRLGG